MTENKYILAIGATILVMALFFYIDKKEHIKIKKNAIVEEESEQEKPLVSSQGAEATKVTPLQAATTQVTNAQSTAALAVSKISENVKIKFSAQMKALAKCFSLPQFSSLENVEPSPDVLLNTMRSSVGDMVVQMDDWSQTEIVENGKKKRIRVDYDYPDGATPSRRLSIYEINAYGMPEIVNLTPDQVNNPNEAYIISLIEGHQVTTEEKGIRAYYSEGEELIYTTKDGYLGSISFSKGIRNFNCNNLSDENSNCVCQ